MTSLFQLGIESQQLTAAMAPAPLPVLSTNNMGLTLSHNTFSGGCHAFSRLQAFICTAGGGSWPPHNDPSLDRRYFYIDESCVGQHGLMRFLRCSDTCDSFSPAECQQIADDLMQLLPAMEALDWPPVGHIQAMGGYLAAARRLIAGFQAAASAGEQLILA